MSNPKTSYTGGYMRRNDLLRLENYVAAATFLSSVAWKREGNANLLVEKKVKKDSDGRPPDAVCIVVGEVLSDKLYVSPTGNYNSKFNTLDAAKFQLTLGRPLDKPFPEDFDLAIRNLENVQEAVATAGAPNMYLILDEGKQKFIRLSAFAFQKRSSPIPRGGTIDDTTANWPVSPSHKGALKEIRETFCVDPLLVYDQHDQLVKPEDIEQKLNGALVEIYFRIKHHYIVPKGGGAIVNSFSGLIEQVLILRPPIPKPPSPYKVEGRKGPYRPKPKGPSDSELENAANIFNPAPPSTPGSVRISAFGLPLTFSSPGTSNTHSSSDPFLAPSSSQSSGGSSSSTIGTSGTGLEDDDGLDYIDGTEKYDIRNKGGHEDTDKDGPPAKKRRIE